jgi:GNAT superfamily N-acetyltransferase
MNIIVRDAAIEDAVQIARIDFESHAVAYRHIFGDTRGANIESLTTRWRRIISRDPELPRRPMEHLLVADTGSDVTGYVAFGASRDVDGISIGEIGAIYVHPQKWRTGIGAAMMSAALKQLAIAGFTEATLWVLEENAIGRAFYDREGWSPDGTIRQRDDGHRELRYRKRLDVQ